jgi:hypothetical protein
MIDLSFCAINFSDVTEPVDFGVNTKYKIKNLMFYSWGEDIRGGTITENNFKHVLLGIKNCSLVNTLKRISVLEIGIEMTDLEDLMVEYEMDHIKLTRDY